MVDVVDKQTRSRMMSGIKGANTKPELLLRRALHARGFRFRTHDPRLPGRPDIVLPKWRVVIEVRGCFWHRHERCPKASTPATNIDFWQTKFQSNVARDKANLDALLAAGWRVLVVWECAIGRLVPEHILDEVTDFVTDAPHNGSRHREIGFV
ncbi:DNA mismatch endonuclease Vsr [Rhodobacter capsulatus]|uniref:Very short patch repair endonuclease n=1 Tax=Rhodobacter capsulatus TaxID=1061 RepID=A0A4U1JLQ8_RHOCA|nr:very short patch repair endonuclease [Rhodobacter capsulatus]TKD13784.1 DNA mismatch endonuclease Vsr [Rhodobacter capsulatus]